MNSVTKTANIEEVAARWVAREDRTLQPEEATALAVWLDEEAANRIAYLRLKSSWSRASRLAALKHSERFSDHSGLYFVFSRASAAAIAATALVAISIVAFSHLKPVQPASYAAQIGEHSTLQLADGTRIQLNTDTKVQTSITSDARTVTLEKGEAYFEVVHDENRPFVVLAGNYRITDLGTKFSVRHEGDNVRVVVSEGQVRVDVIKKPMPTSPVFVGSGNVVVAKADETLVASKSMREISDELSWRTGMLVFNQSTLADAAEEFNRYNRKQILVEGAARDIPIGGSFRADNIEVFSSLVHNALGLTVVDEADKIVISK